MCILCSVIIFICFTDFSESLWSVDESRTVLIALNDILYQRLGFKGNSDNYDLLENSFIDEVSHLMWRLFGWAHYLYKVLYI